ncbi:hypothetical protein PDJAM_G00193510 [Pangasius djambal]|uniref:Uncharacterized protein n=1 Tax=Pangasius djambal TaxID=1691987 RepID=A0ACC5ZQ96_9TELE|nr:hypothetical protein [Pangasius djambal]
MASAVHAEHRRVTSSQGIGGDSGSRRVRCSDRALALESAHFLELQEAALAPRPANQNNTNNMDETS